MCRVLATLAEEKGLFIIFLDIWLLIERITRSPLSFPPPLSLLQPTQIPGNCQLARLARLTIWLPQFIWACLPACLPLSLSFPASRFQLVQSVCYKIRLSSWLMAKDFSCMCVCGGLLKILAKISKRQCFITCLCFVRRFVYCVVYLARVLH